MSHNLMGPLWGPCKRRRRGSPRRRGCLQPVRSCIQPGDWRRLRRSKRNSSRFATRPAASRRRRTALGSHRFDPRLPRWDHQVLARRAIREAEHASRAVRPDRRFQRDGNPQHSDGLIDHELVPHPRSAEVPREEGGVQHHVAGASCRSGWPDRASRACRTRVSLSAGRTGRPGRAGGTGQPGRPSRAGGAGRPGRPSRAGGAGRPGQPSRAGGTGRPGRPSRAGGTGRPGQPSRASRPGCAGRPRRFIPRGTVRRLSRRRCRLRRPSQTSRAGHRERPWRTPRAHPVSRCCGAKCPAGCLAPARARR